MTTNQFLFLTVISLTSLKSASAQDSIQKVYYPNGKLMKEIPYVNGKVNGMKKQYYESGQLQKETPIVNDEANGIQKVYYESGELQWETPWVDDEVNGIGKGYYESGELKMQTPFTNHKANGIRKEYYKSGELKGQTPFTNNEANGVSKTYYMNGRLMWEIPYTNGQKNGVQKSYYNDKYMSLESKTSYTDGKQNGGTQEYPQGTPVVSTDVGNSDIQDVKIGTQTWAPKNLNVNEFRNGDQIFKAESAYAWEKAGKDGRPAWCYYFNDYGNGIKYGRLYNWYAVNDPRGLAPYGWHIPNNTEWKTLIDYLGEYAQIKMKSMDILSGWPRNLTGSNSSGFAALPGGKCNEVGVFDGINTSSYWWSSTGNLGKYAYIYKLEGNYPFNHMEKGYGLSVRCVKD